MTGHITRFTARYPLPRSWNIPPIESPDFKRRVAEEVARFHDLSLELWSCRTHEYGIDMTMTGTCRVSVLWARLSLTPEEVSQLRAPDQDASHPLPTNLRYMIEQFSALPPEGT